MDMQDGVFRAGTSPGSPDSTEQIKMLLCCLLDTTQREISFEMLNEALSEYRLVNYFELVENLDRLRQSGHITMREDDGRALYAVTALGTEAARELEKIVPLSVREKALSAADLLLAREERLSQVRITEEPCGEGYMLELAIPAERGNLLALRAFAPTKAERDLIRRRFLNSPQFIYKGVMALLTGEKSVIGDIFGEHEDELF